MEDSKANYKCGWPWVFHYNSKGKMNAVFKAKLPQKTINDYINGNYWLKNEKR